MHIRSIAILNTNEDREELEPKFPNDGIKYLEFFKPFFPEAQFKIFRAIESELPKNVEDFDLYFITGSVHSAYDTFEWIRKLERLIQELHKRKILLVGFCFGHQIIAKALGGKVKRAKNGWVLGLRSITLNGNLPWLDNNKKTLNIAHIHQDHVTVTPPDSTVISGDALCPNEAFVIGDHVLTIQGHPEFSNKYLKALFPAIKNRFDETTYESAMNRMHLPNDGAIFAQLVKKFCDHYQKKTLENKKMSNDFSQRCYDLLKKIPKGKVTTYTEIAKALNSKAYRAVGNAMAKNKNLIKIPCHRVVQKNGDIGKYALGQAKKIELLESEGVKIESERVVDFHHYLHTFGHEKNQ